jgi:DNA-binding NarL/FixJ family response regulator
MNMRVSTGTETRNVQGMTPHDARTQLVAIEDDSRYRAGLEALLEHSAEFHLAHCFASPTAALRALDEALQRRTPPPWDLVLMDLDLPELSGIECTRRIKARLADVRVVVLTVFEDRATILEAICAGADGYLLKRTPADGLLAQLRAVLAGGAPLSPAIARTVLDVVRLGATGRLRMASAHEPDGATQLQLTPRELEVLTCLVNGKSYKACARHLDISLDTVRSHIRGIYAKLQVHNVAEAVSRALRDHLV